MNGFKGVYYPCIWLVVVLFFSACNGDGLDVGISNESVGVNVADTLTVEASTFLLDPLPTTGQGVLLVGRINDDDFGQVESQSYFRLSNENLSLSSLPENARYDSVSVSLYYNGYSYGDTTKFIRVNIHRVMEDIEPYEFPIALEDDEYPVFVSSSSTTLLANREFAYDEQPLGSVLFRPRPNTPEDSVVTIKLADDFGQTLFDMAMNEDTRLTINDDFVNFLKGMALVSADDSYGAVIGFQDSLALEIHYSSENQTTSMREEGVITFPMGGTAYQFNRIITDRQGTALAELSEDNGLSPSLTGNRSYIQGSTGVVTRLRFPTAALFINESIMAVSKAQLVIETDQSRDLSFPPPNSLILMKANKYGTPVSILTGSYQSDTQTAYYQVGNQSGGVANGQYVFDLTGYMNELRNSVADEAESLLLTLPTSTLMSTVDHLKIAVKDGKPAIKLQVIYVKF